MNYIMTQAINGIPSNAVVQLINVDFSQRWKNALILWNDKEYWVPFGLLREI